MDKKITMTQSQMRSLLTDAFLKGRDFQRSTHENGPISPDTEKARYEWAAYLKKMCGNNY